MDPECIIHIPSNFLVTFCDTTAGIRNHECNTRQTPHGQTDVKIEIFIQDLKK